MWSHGVADHSRGCSCVHKHASHCPLVSRARTHAGAGRVLPARGVLYIYGPFQENGRQTAPSNAAFDASLRARNPDWGVRDIAKITDLAVRNGFELIEQIAMPANNLTVVFHRLGAGHV